MPAKIGVVDEAFRIRLAAIEWAKWETAHGSAVNVRKQLECLCFAPDESERQDAAHALWCGLCHQHAYVSAASLPALPFLLEILDIADDGTAVEILDILAGFAWWTRPEQPETLPEWANELRKCIAAELPRFRDLAGHVNEVIAAWFLPDCEISGQESRGLSSQFPRHASPARNARCRKNARQRPGCRV